MSTLNTSPPTRRGLTAFLHTTLESLGRWWEQVRLLYHCLNLIRFNIILGAICSLSLFTGQGQDILRALVEVEPWYRHSVPKLSFLFLTASFGWTAWYFTRVMYLFSFPGEKTEHLSPDSYESLKTIKTHVARFLGPVIFFLISGALIKAASSYASWTDSGSLQLLGMALLLNGGALGALYVAYWNRRPVFLRNLQQAHFSSLQSFFQLPPMPRRWLGIAITANFLALVTFSFWSGMIGPWIGTAGILMLWATSMVAIGGAFVYVGNAYRVPIIGLLFCLAVIFAWFNDNHRVRQQADMRPYEVQQAHWKEVPSQLFKAMLGMGQGIMSRGFTPTNDPLETYFVSWFENLKTTWEGKNSQSGTPVPLILVSAEGGGIRAAYWTASVLTELQDRSQKLVDEGRLPTTFARHVFSISGVSGGSLGAAVFASLVKDQRASPGRSSNQDCPTNPSISFREQAQSFLSQDFLSPTIGVMLFPDMLQRFLPFPILDDRALALEQSWERAWSKCVGSDRFARPFDDLWEDHRYDVPLLFLNSTVVETGQRLIMHPLPFAAQKGGSDRRLNSDPTNTRPFQYYFNDALDGPAVLGGQVPLSTAVHMSARFTYVSPAGTIFRQDLSKDYAETESPDPRVIRVVDGGYFENSGAVTTDEILLAIQRIAEKNSFTIRPIVIHISNDPLQPQLRQQEHFTGSHAFLPEVLSPVWALLNVRPARGYQARDVLGDRAEIGLHQHFTNTSLSLTEGVFAQFQLCEYQHRLPLGWMLSEFSRQEIDAQLPRNEQGPGATTLKAAHTNFRNLETVLLRLAGTTHPPEHPNKPFTHYNRDCVGNS